MGMRSLQWILIEAANDVRPLNAKHKLEHNIKGVFIIEYFEVNWTQLGHISVQFRASVNTVTKIRWW